MDAWKIIWNSQNNSTQACKCIWEAPKHWAYRWSSSFPSVCPPRDYNIRLQGTLALTVQPRSNKQNVRPLHVRGTTNNQNEMSKYSLFFFTTHVTALSHFYKIQLSFTAVSFVNGRTSSCSYVAQDIWNCQMKNDQHNFHHVPDVLEVASDSGFAGHRCVGYIFFRCWTLPTFCSFIFNFYLCDKRFSHHDAHERQWRHGPGYKFGTHYLLLYNCF